MLSNFVIVEVTDTAPPGDGCDETVIYGPVLRSVNRYTYEQIARSVVAEAVTAGALKEYVPKKHYVAHLPYQHTDR